MSEVTVALIAIAVSIIVAFIDHQIQRRRDSQHKLEDLYKLVVRWRLNMGPVVGSGSTSKQIPEDVIADLAVGIDTLTDIKVIIDIYFEEHLSDVADMISAVHASCLRAISEGELSDEHYDLVSDTAERAIDLILQRRILILDIWPR